jgi:FkbM family methyltransferase
MWRLRVFHAARRAERALLPARLASSPLATKISARLDRAWSQWLLRGSGEDVTIAIEGGTLLLPKRYIQHYVMHEYEPVTQRAFLNALAPGMVVVDVGAHIGYFTVLASRHVGPSGRVHAVEPSEENLWYLRENIARNGLTNVTVHPVAAGSAHGKREFHVTEASDSHGFYNHPHAATLQTIEMEQAPLSDLVTGHVDLLKIDVEGAEIEVLSGIGSMLAQRGALALCVEWNPSCMKNAGYDPLDLPRKMWELGFERIEVLDDLKGGRPPLDEVSSLVASGAVPHFWYVNLWSRRS